MSLPDEWPPERARSREDWDAYWSRQRRDRRMVHDHVRPFLWRMKRRVLIPRGWWRQARWFVQRGRRGWADRDAGSLDDYLCRVAGESVAHLRQHAHGYPCACAHSPGADGIHRAPVTCTCEADYDAALGKISGPLLAYQDHHHVKDGTTWQEHAAREAEIIAAAQDALRLLAEHLPSLWD